MKTPTCLPLADAPPMQPAEESKQPEPKEEEEGSDEDAPLIEPLTILKLLSGFCGDGTTPPDADKREKAGRSTLGPVGDEGARMRDWASRVDTVGYGTRRAGSSGRSSSGHLHERPRLASPKG